MLRRGLTASAITIITAIVAASAASAVPPREAARFPGVAPAANTAAPAVPTFVNGLSQAVFAQGSANWINHELWVETSMDTDGDGKLDRVHVDVSRPTETETDDLKVPVVYEDSPYYAGGADVINWDVDHEIGEPPTLRERAPFLPAANTSPVISTTHENTWVPRGFAVVHSESPGTGHSDGCPNSGAPIETEGAVAVVDWLNGRAKGYTTRAGDVEVAADWTNGRVGMIGTSYNGTLPIAAASTGVEGLEAIVPISAISDWYDYYRANGMVRAPGGFQGEDLDVLSEYIYTRADETGPARIKCWPQIEQLKVDQDRVTGNRSALWQERNYMKDVGNLEAATLLAHGNNDFNVMTKHAAQLYEALKEQGVPHQFYFHQGGHGGAPPDVLTNYWFTRYLWGHQNGVENLPKSWVVRTEPGACPPRESTVAGEHANTATLAVANASPFRIGFTLTVPQTNANGTITSTTRVITNIAGNTLTLATPVATAAGQRVVDGATVSLVCGNPNPTPYPEWPDPGASDAVLHLTPGAPGRGGLTFAAGSGQETLVDDAGVTASTLMNAASEDSRLLYQTNVLKQPVRISGTPRVSLTAAFDREKANLTAILVSLPETGDGTILTRGWIDPQNRSSDWTTEPVNPGTFYRLDFDMQPKDVVVPAGRRLGLMVLSSDREFTVRPEPGTRVTLDVAASRFSIPIVGGAAALVPATGGDVEEGTVTGNVPATLSLTLGTPASFGAFTPGVARDYLASMSANVISSAGEARLTVVDHDGTNTGKLVNGAFALAQPLHARANDGVFAPVGGAASPTSLLSYSGPVSNDSVSIGFRQSIGANDALRTGVYRKTLTFTLSTTEP
jgi:predicted acyl esterase